MKIHSGEKHVVNQLCLKDEKHRQNRRLEEIKTRKPLYTLNSSVPSLPIIQSMRNARINHSKQISQQNQVFVLRLEKLNNRKSEYSSKSRSHKVSNSLSPSKTKIN